jgi:hypothetical protein
LAEKAEGESVRVKGCLVVFLCVFALGQTPSSDIDARLQAAAIGMPAPHNQAEFIPNLVESWSNGYLVNYHSKKPLAVYDRTGKWLFENSLALPDAVKVVKLDATVTNSGVAIVATSAVNADGAVADMLVQVTKDGIGKIIRTNPFYPIKVCAMNDGTVWAWGTEMTNDRSAEPRPNYPMLREYSFEKGQMRTDLDRASFHQPKTVPLYGLIGDLKLRCGVGKVLLISGNTNEVMEYDLSTSQLSRWPMKLPEGFYVNGAAFTDAGKIYISVMRDVGKFMSGVMSLQMKSGIMEWTPLTMIYPKGSTHFLLVGSEGEDLIYSRGRGNATLFWAGVK